MLRKNRKYKDKKSMKAHNTGAAGYIRLCVSDEEGKNSIENQKRIIEDWGCQNQIPILHHYIDNGFSGMEFKRPAFEEMIRDIIGGRINCIVVKELFRLGRDYITTVDYIKKYFLEKKIHLVLTNEKIDTVDCMTNKA